MLALAALAVVLIATAVWAMAAWRLSMPDNRLPFFSGWGVGALLGLLALFSGTNHPGAAWTALVLGGMLFGIALFTRQTLEARAIEPGDRIPEFSAPDEDGNLVSSTSFGGTPLLLKFFRGHW